MRVCAPTNCEEAELFLNGSSLGRKAANCIETPEWQVSFAPGTLRVVGYVHGKEAARDEVSTAGVPVAIRAKADRLTLTNSGKNAVTVDLAVVDAEGRVLPDAADLLHFSTGGGMIFLGAGNGGPMISKALFDEFLAPFYRRVIPVIHSYGIPVYIDSDGDITQAVDWYASVGADGMFPLERQAGVDVSTYLDKQPQMTFLGHFDKMCMKHGEEAMRAEFERILPSMLRGKVIPSCDHQTPPDVSMENYRIYVKLLKEYAARVHHETGGILPCPVYAGAFKGE